MFLHVTRVPKEEMPGWWGSFTMPTATPSPSSCRCSLQPHAHKIPWSSNHCIHLLGRNKRKRKEQRQRDTSHLSIPPVKALIKQPPLTSLDPRHDQLAKYPPKCSYIAGYIANVIEFTIILIRKNSRMDIR